MNCTNCRAPLPQGAAICPNCGASNPYNITDPAASPYNPYGSPSQPQAPQNIPNAQSAPPPSTAYGSPTDPYGYPQGNPYEQQNNPYPSYGATMPSQAPYGNPAPNPPQYGVPPTGYGYQQGAPGGTVPAMPGGYGGFAQPQPPPKRRSRVGLIIGIVILVLVLGCGGLFATLAYIGSKAPATSNTTSTPGTVATKAPVGAVPASSQISAAAAAILTEAQTSSAVDSNYLPTKPTQNFTSKQTIYLTFHVDSQGNNGYIAVKWFLNGQLLTSDKLAHSAANDHGYFSLPYNEAGQGAAAMYWGTKADLSDSQLALVVNFNVA